MPWQKINRHVSDERVVVESKSGNAYPARVEYDWMGEALYEQMINESHDHLTFWAWVDFDGDNDAVVEDWTRNRGDYPGAPPWDR